MPGAGFRSERGCAFSLYLDLDPSSTPTPADAETRLRSLLARAEKEFANGGGRAHDEKVAVGRDLERIRQWWSGEFDRDGARGVAIFVSGTDRFWRVLPLPRAVPGQDSQAVPAAASYRRTFASSGAGRAAPLPGATP